MFVLISVILVLILEARGHSLVPLPKVIPVVVLAVAVAGIWAVAVVVVVTLAVAVAIAVSVAATDALQNITIICSSDFKPLCFVVARLAGWQGGREQQPWDVLWCLWLCVQSPHLPRLFLVTLVCHLGGGGGLNYSPG